MLQSVNAAESAFTILIKVLLSKQSKCLEKVHKVSKVRMVPVEVL